MVALFMCVTLMMQGLGSTVLMAFPTSGGTAVENKSARSALGYVPMTWWMSG